MASPKRCAASAAKSTRNRKRSTISDVKSEHDYLLFAYDLIGLQLTHFLDDVTHLQTRAPQSFAAAIAADQAQHLVVLRQLLGADLSESVPEAFDTGEVPPPEG